MPMPVEKMESRSSAPKRKFSASGTSSDMVSSSSVSISPIDNMYKIYEKLNSAEDKTTLEAEFKELLQSVHRSEKEKRLASQFITRFMEYFPLHYQSAVDALIDLCEHDDPSMRRQVVRDLITVCKKVSSFVPKIADIFAQLMLTKDPVELGTLQKSVISLFHIDGKAVLIGLFSQISIGLPLVRDRVITFLSTKLKDLSPEITTLDFERTLFAEVKLVSKVVTPAQYNTLIVMLKETKFFRQLSGQQALVDILAQEVDLDNYFNANDPEEIKRLTLILKHSQAIFSSQISCTRFAVYLCTKVIPQLRDRLTEHVENRPYQEILKMTCEITSEVHQMDRVDAVNCLESLYEELIDSMPLPEGDSTDPPNFQFSRLEIFLFLFHKLSQQHPEYITQDEDRLKDFRNRLQYVARGAQTFMRKLREDLEVKRGEDLKAEATRIKIIALKVSANLSAMIRDMFHSPPIYKASVSLSWVPLTGTRSGTAKKRPMVRAISAPNNKNERVRELYQPPGGKFSSRAGVYVSPVRGQQSGSWGFGRSNVNRNLFRGRRGGMRPGKF